MRNAQTKTQTTRVVEVISLLQNKKVDDDDDDDFFLTFKLKMKMNLKSVTWTRTPVTEYKVNTYVFCQLAIFSPSPNFRQSKIYSKPINLTKDKVILKSSGPDIKISIGDLWNYLFMYWGIWSRISGENDWIWRRNVLLEEIKKMSQDRECFT